MIKYRKVILASFLSVFSITGEGWSFQQDILKKLPAIEKLDSGGVGSGSVKPTLEMEEQILECVSSNGSKAQIMVKVVGIQGDAGNIRVQVYSDKEEDFLELGKKVTRVDVGARDEEMQVCMTFPNEGTYAIAVLHDRNANGRVDILTEGFGFSNNPSITFSPPDHDETTFSVKNGVGKMEISLMYIFEMEQTERRRRRRR